MSIRRIGRSVNHGINTGTGLRFFSGRRTRIVSLLGLSAALVVVVVLATSVGSVHIPLADHLPYLAGQTALRPYRPDLAERHRDHRAGHTAAARHPGRAGRRRAGHRRRHLPGALSQPPRRPLPHRRGPGGFAGGRCRFPAAGQPGTSPGSALSPCSPSSGRCWPPSPSTCWRAWARRSP